MKKQILIFIAVVIVIAAGSFYAGTKYGQSKNSAPGNLKNLTAEQRQQMLQNGGANFQGMRQNRTGAQGSSNFLNGEIMSKDEKSLTLKLPDGGSRIIFYSGSTTISKNATGTIEDLNVGQNVMVSGSANQDNSLTAESIQLRPNSAPVK